MWTMSESLRLLNIENNVQSWVDFETDMRLIMEDYAVMGFRFLVPRLDQDLLLLFPVHEWEAMLGESEFPGLPRLFLTDCRARKLF